MPSRARDLSHSIIMANFTRDINNLLSSGDAPALKAMLDHARNMAKITAALRQKIDSPVSGHITVANIRQGTAIILVDSPTWLGKIRYLAPMLQELLCAMGIAVRGVEFKSQPRRHMIETRPKPGPSMSAEAGKRLTAAALSTEDEQLRTALLRLASHGVQK